MEETKDTKAMSILKNKKKNNKEMLSLTEQKLQINDSKQIKYILSM